MLIIGLTGSIGMGKSTAAERFRQRGIAVFDADAEVHRLYEGPMATVIEAAFPGTVRDGKVDRKELSRILVREPHRFSELERIVHPRVREREREFLRAEHRRGAELAVLEIPLLLESKAGHMVDAIVVVSAGADIQRRRVLARPGMTPEKLEELISRQMKDEEKRRHADFVVDTGGSVESCHAQVDAIISTLESRPGTAFERHWR
jgi:dephospho-CoA kinase